MQRKVTFYALTRLVDLPSMLLITWLLSIIRPPRYLIDELNKNYWVCVNKIHFQTSMVFDITLPGEFDGCVTYHQPVAVPLPIKPFTLRVPSVQMSSEMSEVNCELCKNIVFLLNTCNLTKPCF
jgi:hypothetical protein